MNIYFVFQGQGYYPTGGWDDNAQIFYTEESAIKHAKDIGWGEWSHIVEFNVRTLQGKLIKRYQTDQSYGRPLIVEEVAIDYSKIIEKWEIDD